MAELSIEEKAKRYDEAIEKARIWKDKSGMPKDKQGILDDIFPELRESEDERTRESLLEYLHTLPNHYTHSGVCVLEWIAWIEKQAQKPVWTEEDKNMLKWVIGYLENKMLNTPISEERTACKNAIAWFKKLEGEQKPADNLEQKKLKKTKFKIGDRIIGIVSGMQYYITEVCDDHYCTESGCIIMFCSQENFELYKQKPAEWSEEDERMLKSIITLCDEKMKSTSYQSVIDHAIDVKNWLKSLKDRVQPQPQWKPSYEQISVLEFTMESIEKDSIRYAVLNSILEQLMKLVEE